MTESRLLAIEILTNRDNLISKELLHLKQRLGNCYSHTKTYDDLIYEINYKQKELRGNLDKLLIEIEKEIKNLKMEYVHD